MYELMYKRNKHGHSHPLPELFDVMENGELATVARPTTSTPFSIQNIQISKAFSKNFTAYGGVRNLFNTIQKESPLVGWNDPNATPGFSEYFDTGYAYGNTISREFYLGLKWNLQRNK